MERRGRRELLVVRRDERRGKGMGENGKSESVRREKERRACIKKR